MSIKYSVVIHDFHGFWTHHPHRAIRAFMVAWQEVFGCRPPSNLAVEILHRPSTMTIREKAAQMALAQGKSSDLAEKFAVTISSHYEKIYIPNKGLRPLVAKLNKLGVIQIVLTNGYLHQVKPVIEAWGMSPYLHAIYGRVVGGNRPKPEIDLQELSRELGISWEPKRFLLVGDYFEDLRTAQQSGVKSVLMVTSRAEHYPKDVPEDELVLPDFLILEPKELLDIVQGKPRRNIDEERSKALSSPKGLRTRTTNIWDNWGGEKILDPC